MRNMNNLKKCSTWICFYLAAVILCSCSRNDAVTGDLYQAVNTLERKQSGRVILCIGDSNGRTNGGWPGALAAELTQDRVLNRSVGGLTIGFDNCGNPEWNALKNIHEYFGWALIQCERPIDEVLICLGTNDSKACFEDRKDRVAPNLIKLIQKIRHFDNAGSASPRITIITPLPYAPDSLNLKKARGGDVRVRNLVPRFRDVALGTGCGYVDIHAVIEPVFHDVAMDHVHLTEEGHAMAAAVISAVLNDRQAPDPPSEVRHSHNTLSWKPSPSRDVIGYEIMNGRQMMRAVADTQIRLPEGCTDLRVRARDGYGNVSREVK